MGNEESANYRLVEVLTPERTYLCTDVSDNLVILKALDADCLHRDQLHPAIRDRLGTIRELAHPHVAALRTVERWNGQTCMVWVYVPGQTLDQASAESSGNLADLRRGLSEAVTRLHELGIVHGNLRSGNIIVQGDGAVWLTDMSPYLYADPQVDLDAVGDLLPDTVETLESLDRSPPQRDFRLGPLIASVACAVLMLIIFVAVSWSVTTPRETLPATFPSLRH